MVGWFSPVLVAHPFPSLDIFGFFWGCLCYAGLLQCRTSLSFFCYILPSFLPCGSLFVNHNTLNSGAWKGFCLFWNALTLWHNMYPLKKIWTFTSCDSVSASWEELVFVSRDSPETMSPCFSHRHRGDWFSFFFYWGFGIGLCLPFLLYSVYYNKENVLQTLLRNI